MKKSALILIMAFALAVCPSFVYAAGPTPEPTEKTAEAARAEVLLNRLEEIKSMDKSEMTRTEKRALRKEVKSIKSELAANNNGIYLSVGAIIIIILLLILLL